MQRQQEEAIAELKMKLNEHSQVKDELIKMNEFKPNVSFSQDSFGHLYLYEYSNIDPFKSQILTGNQPSELIKLCEFSLSLTNKDNQPCKMRQINIKNRFIVN